ncbi:hypothetical protein [Xanthomonas euvesicatoria]|uniref:hypothetical protein n=1 Tax=Xanthomonas euvesicatoria TaxID=456327 RepID=UPI001C489F14|nr:hypothetical protein [Xanthomonas euvesicatoria]MBV6882643.1 hypothetical protein [Xanthomonas campestris pv. euphorbiae]
MALADKEDTQNMVLRTVFLPPALDDRLRDVAFESRVSKGDLIRSLVTAALNSLQTDPGVKGLTSLLAKSSKKQSNLIATSKVASTSKLPVRRLTAKKATKKLVK